jgi:outer membrane cobalamin receptor
MPVMQRIGAPIWLAIVVTAMACVRPVRGTDSGGASHTMTITAADITRSSDANAWEILRTHAHRFTYQEDQSGRPVQILARRGASSIVLSNADSPMVIVDGARLINVRGLSDIPASAISSIEIFSGIAGTGTQGTNAASGVIYIHTHEASNP